MPKKVYFPINTSEVRSGIDIIWTPSSQRLDIGGWYDSFVGIQTTSISLLEFFKLLGITEKDCQKAWRKK
jgi:hypothetical protein